MIKQDDEEVWTWYQHISKFQKSGIPQKQFAEREGICYKKLCNMLYRIVYKSHSDQRLYNKLMKIGRAYLDSGNRNSSQFAKENGIESRHLSEIVTHINYLDLIERLKKEKEKSMEFIKVPNSPQAIRSHSASPSPYTHMVPAQSAQSAEPEVVEKQNDLEIIIAKGVRVSIAPNIEPMKIIKIIELLKDL